MLTHSFLNTQTWAVLAEIAENGDELLDFVEKELQTPFDLVLAKPAFSKSDMNIGLASFMDKGCCENGSIYNHGVAFKIAADCKLGRSEAAYNSLKKLLPVNSGIAFIKLKLLITHQDIKIKQR